MAPGGYIYQGMGTTIIDGESVRSEQSFLESEEEQFERNLDQFGRAATLPSKSPKSKARMSLAPARG